MTALSALTRYRIGDFLLAKRVAGYAPRTVWCMFKITRAMLTAARLDDGVLREDVTARVGRLLPKRNDQPAIDAAFRPEELAAFLAAAEKLHPRLARFFIVAGADGPPPGRAPGPHLARRRPRGAGPSWSGERSTGGTGRTRRRAAARPTSR